MQDRYAGDLGDFSKLGLLRALCGGGRWDRSLGLAWYLAPEEDHNNDGRHVDYLAPGAANHARFRACDPPLYDALGGMLAAGGRSVGALQALPVWPERTAFFDERLDWGALRGRDRAAWRAAWGRRGLAALEGVDVVCADPDNGLAPTSAHPTRKGGPKFAWPDELQPYAARGQTLVVYQHAHRQAAAEVQAANAAATLAAALDRPVRALSWRRGTRRFYLVAPAPAHRGWVDDRLDALLGGPWGAHFSLS